MIVHKIIVTRLVSYTGSVLFHHNHEIGLHGMMCEQPIITGPAADFILEIDVDDNMKLAYLVHGM